MMTYWLVQLVGLIAVAICIYAYTRQHDQNLKTGLAASKFIRKQDTMIRHPEPSQNGNGMAEIQTAEN